VGGGTNATLGMMRHIQTLCTDSLNLNKMSLRKLSEPESNRVCLKSNTKNFLSKISNVMPYGVLIIHSTEKILFYYIYILSDSKIYQFDLILRVPSQKHIKN